MSSDKHNAAASPLRDLGWLANPSDAKKRQKNRCEYCRHRLQVSVINGVTVREPCQTEFCQCRAQAAFVNEPDWRTVKLGLNCLFPCRRCGCVIDDILDKGRICYRCGPLAAREKLLKETIPYLERIGLDSLIIRIKEVLPRY